MYKLMISPIAREDLVRTKKYLNSEYGVETSNRILETIVSSLKKFEEFPFMGRPLTNLIDVPTDYMYFVIKKNYVFYRLEDHMVRVIRILSTRQDFMMVLFGDCE